MSKLKQTLVPNKHGHASSRLEQRNDQLDPLLPQEDNDHQYRTLDHQHQNQNNGAGML